MIMITIITSNLEAGAKVENTRSHRLGIVAPEGKDNEKPLLRVIRKKEGDKKGVVVHVAFPKQPNQKKATWSLNNTSLWREEI